MCGIAGIFGGKSRAGLGAIGAMLDAIPHRGPDDEGAAFLGAGCELPVALAGTDADAMRSPKRYAPRTRFDGTVPEGATCVLGHRRLSILDLSPAGHGPFCSPDGRYWITYNGEVYNYLELRAELEALGDTFVTGTDTEVLLAAYARWGADALPRFNGMWAFVIVDRVANKAFAARDRFGVKPLYRWTSPAGFTALASEIKQFTALPGWRAVADPQRLYDFVTWSLSDHTGGTLFRDVHQLRGGECLEFDLDAPERVRTRAWYTLSPRPFEGTLDEAAGEFKRLLSDSVGLRLRADVDVGSCLSGGLDSSSIVCLVQERLAAQGLTARQKTFSALSSVKRFDEREYIDAVLDGRELDAHFTTPALAELFDLMPELTWHQDEPFGSTSIYAQYRVFELAAAHRVKVMLDGQGADEQLAGYHGYFTPRFAGLFKRLEWATLVHEIRESDRLHGYGARAAVRKLATALLPEPVLDRVKGAMHLSTAAPAWLDLDRLGAEVRNPFARHDTIAGMSHAQLTSVNLPMLLHWEDRDSMAHSIESRVPFLDYRLVEFVLGLPDAFKLSDGITKRVLREGMRGVLPERVRNRMDKMGFVTPEEVWLRQDAPDAFRQALDRAIAASHGILRPSARDELERLIAGAPFHTLPWRLISLGAWMERFEVQVA